MEINKIDLFPGRKVGIDHFITHSTDKASLKQYFQGIEFTSMTRKRKRVEVLSGS